MMFYRNSGQDLVSTKTQLLWLGYHGREPVTSRSGRIECSQLRHHGYFESVRQEAGAAHGDCYFRVPHEGVPDKLRTGVLGHQHGDTDVDSQHVFAGPSGHGIEGIDEP